MHQLALDIMSCVPSRSSLNRVTALLRGDLGEAIKGVNPKDFTQPDAYLKAAQEAALIRKMPNLVNNQTSTLRQRAIDTFYACEETCRQTNVRLAWWDNQLSHPFVDSDEDVTSVDKMTGFIRRAQKLARQILGPLPDEIVPAFSGGSSFLNVAKKSTLPHKLGGACAVTERLRDVFPLLVDKTLWSHLLPEYGIETVQGNRFTTVVKDSEKDRGICVEPLGNLAYQLPSGKAIRRRLKHFGIDIRNVENSPFKGQNLHRLIARFASVDNDYATIDLSNASDTVCYMLVKLILPKDWFEWLTLLRSPMTRIEDDWVKLQKFSSMGNGYTFELETLLFYVLVRTCCGHGAVSVYGDDIVLPSENYEDVSSMLAFFGFTVNTKKSFSDGPFRESCGGDFFLGEPVRPVFLDDNPQNPMEWITLQNKLFQIEELLNWDLAVPVNRIAQSIPTWCRVYGPPGTPGCLWTRDASRWHRRNKGDGISSQRVLMPLPNLYVGWRKRKEALACALLGVPSKGAAHRDIAGWRLAWISVS